MPCAWNSDFLCKFAEEKEKILIIQPIYIKWNISFQQENTDRCRLTP